MLRAAWFGIAAFGIAGWAPAGQFIPGDIYLLTHDYPGTGRAIVRIDPQTGDKAVIVEHSQLGTHLTHDPFRDRLIARTTFPVDTFRYVDPNGAMTTIDPGVIYDAQSWTPRGDGIIYVGGGAATRPMFYIDAADEGHELLAADGIGSFFPGVSFRELIYDSGTNALFLGYGNNSNYMKVPLTPDGTQVSGPVTLFSCDSYPGNEAVRGLSAGPGGSLFGKIDVNSGSGGVMMYTFDPVTLVSTPFASMGGYLIGGDTSGSYNPTFDYGISVDTGADVLRIFSAGETDSDGTILATGISGAGGSAEATQLIVIGATVGTAPPCPADLTGDGSVDLSDLALVLSLYGTAEPAGDVNGDGTVDLSDLAEVLAAFGASGCG